MDRLEILIDIKTDKEDYQTVGFHGDGEEKYAVVIDYEFNWIECTCPAGKFKKNCKHVDLWKRILGWKEEGA